MTIFVGEVIMYKDKAIRRIAKSHRHLIDGDRKFRFEYIYFFILLFFDVFIIIFGFIKSKDNDRGEYILVSQTAMFMTIAYYSVSMMTGFSTNFKQRNAVKGSSSLNDMFAQFPVTKIQCMKYSFNKWAKISLFSAVIWNFVIIQSMLLKRPSLYKGEIGFIVVVIILMQTYLLYVYVFSYKVKIKIRSALLYIMIFFIFFYMFIALFLYKNDTVYLIIKGFKAFSGPLGLAFLNINIPIMYLIGKIFVFTNKKSEA